MWNVEEIWRKDAYHEAAHAVVDVVLLTGDEVGAIVFASARCSEPRSH